MARLTKRRVTQPQPHKWTQTPPVALRVLRLVRPVPRKARLIAHRADANSAQTTADTGVTDAATAQTDIDEHEAEHPAPGTQVFVDTAMPTGGEYQLDDIWIRDVTNSPWQIYKWTGTVWSLTFTDPGLTAAQVANVVKAFAIIGNDTQAGGDVTGVYLRAAGGTLPDATEARYNANAVTELDGVWHRLQLTGHGTAVNVWTWADLNDGQTDLAGFRGIVSENPFSIGNPQVLDWAYISGEHRWVRRNSSTWVYAPGPQNFDSRYRSQHAAERGGQVSIGRFIFDSNKHAMRIIRDYQGSVPGPATYAWIAFDGPTLNLEDWAYRDESIQVQARKLAQFPPGEIASIPNLGQKFFSLTARVHKNADGSATSYDLAQWEVVSTAPPAPAAPTYTQLGTATLVSNLFNFASADASNIAAEIIDGTCRYLLLVLADFNRHYHIWEIPLRWRTYSEGPNYEWYKEYVNNSTGALSAVNFAVEQNTGAAATATLSMLTASGIFDAGTNLTVYGVS